MQEKCGKTGQLSIWCEESKTHPLKSKNSKYWESIYQQGNFYQDRKSKAVRHKGVICYRIKDGILKANREGISYIVKIRYMLDDIKEYDRK